jgi:hypothetical protein
MGSLPDALGWCTGRVEGEEVSRMTGLFPGGAGGTRCVPEDDRPCLVNC